MLDSLGAQLRLLWDQALHIWTAGGWAMIPIAGAALAAFGVGMHVYLSLRAKEFESVPEESWRPWIDHPELRSGPIGRLLDFAAGAATLKDTALAFGQLRAAETAPFERDLRVMKVCINAAPLLGLLGTVTGMLATFGALASGSGGEQTMSLVSEGISVALITTETGLVIALPGLFFQYQMQRKLERYQAFLAHLESACTQTLYRELRRQDRLTARRAAQIRVARALLQRLGGPRPAAQTAN